MSNDIPPPDKDPVALQMRDFVKAHPLYRELESQVNELRRAGTRETLAKVAKEARMMALEEAAKLCEGWYTLANDGQRFYAGQELARHIRELGKGPVPSVKADTP